MVEIEAAVEPQEKSRVKNPTVNRQKLLEAASEEIHLNGFQATGLDQILKRAGLTKGALYHHFSNKMELGYAVVEEVIRPKMEEDWIVPFSQSDDPEQTFLDILEKSGEEMSFEEMKMGCPFNNLMLEMSPIDEGFRLRLMSILEEWKNAMAEAFRRGMDSGKCRTDLDPDAIAHFLIAGLEGSIVLIKNTQDPSVLETCLRSFVQYLKTLRP